MRIAFLGPEGTFTEEALLASAPSSASPAPVSTVYGSVLAVQENEVESAFVPIENSLEGSVSDTLDALVFDAPDVFIVREVTHPIRHHLIAARKYQLAEIKKLISHPHAKAQCQRFLREHLTHAEITASNSTAEAVQMVSATNDAWAALGTELAASLYNCEILQSDVEDSEDNRTRFVYLARSPNPLPAIQRSKWKTSIACGIGKDRPGALLEILGEFADRMVNLTKIESRPAKTSLGAYLFFIDAEGRKSDNGVREALTALEKSLESLRILGSYPVD